MKATGIVRRIDDLGRVVIPKEIRRTMRIREGDPLEIYTDSDGEVIFKKYSPIGELSRFATLYIEALVKSTEMPVVICDRDHCIAAGALSKKEVLERRIAGDYEDIIELRRPFIRTASDMKSVSLLEGVDYKAGIAVPVISQGDICGSIAFILPDEKYVPNEADVKLAQVAASFLGKQMEE